MPVLSERISKLKVSAVMAMQKKAAELRAQGIDLVHFGIGEPDFNTPEHIKRAAFKALEQNQTKYTYAGGISELKNAIADKYRHDYGASFNASDEVTVSNGGKQALYNLMLAIISPGDDVLLPSPYWVSFPEQISFAGGNVIPIDASEENGFAITTDQVEAAITPNTKAIILNFPNNPSGATMKGSEIEKIVSLARAKNFYVIFDECYEKFVYDGDPISGAPYGKENVVLVGSCSKTYSMTGWRIGWAAASADIINGMENLQGQTTSNPNSIAQWAAVEAISGDQSSTPKMLAEYRTRRDHIVSELREIPGIQCNLPQGAFYVFPNISGCYRDGVQDSASFSTWLLEKAHVITVPGIEFGRDGHIRISYATSMDRIKEGLSRMKKLLC